MNLAGQQILVTGASSGIGAATAVALARRGGKVWLLGRDAAALERVAAECVAAGGQAVTCVVDLADLDAVAAATERLRNEHGTPDVIVNNAGAGRWRFVDETSPAEAAELMAVPYLGAFAVTQAFLGDMLRRNHGHFVTVTSPVAFFPWPGAAAYSVARWAMRGFHEVLRSDLFGTQIDTTLVVPGKVDSNFFRRNPGSEERLPKIARLFPTLTPERVASAIVRGIERRRRLVVVPFTLRLALTCQRLCPGLVEWLVRVTGWKRR